MAIAGVFVLTILTPVPAEAWITSTCRNFAAEVRKNKKHRAIAVRRHLDTEYCGGTWNEPSREIAIKRALEVCKRISSKPCTIVFAE